jgi:hypothetical protein
LQALLGRVTTSPTNSSKSGPGLGGLVQAFAEWQNLFLLGNQTVSALLWNMMCAKVAFRFAGPQKGIGQGERPARSSNNEQWQAWRLPYQNPTSL